MLYFLFNISNRYSFRKKFFPFFFTVFIKMLNNSINTICVEQYIQHPLYIVGKMLKDR